MRAFEPKVGHDSVAVKAPGIGLTRMFAHFDLVTEIQFDEFDSIEETFAGRGGELPQGVTIAGAGHSHIDLGQKADIGRGEIQQAANRRDVRQPLGIEGCDGKAGRPRRNLPRQNLLDQVKGCERADEAGMVLRDRGRASRLIQQLVRQ